MYTLSENLDNTEFNGWINEDILIKDNRRSTTSRKRNYDLVNVDLGEECEDIRRRVLRPRHNTEPQSSNGASRTRPIRSNRARRRPALLPHGDQQDVPLSEEIPQPIQDIISPDSTFTASDNELSLFQALMSYSWPQNYLFAHADPSLLQRLPQTSYSALNNIQLSPMMAHFDPWVLHNYLLATSNYSSMTGSHLSPDSSLEDSARNMSHLGYPSLVSESVLNANFIWQYPFMLNPPYNPLQSHTTHPSISSNMAASNHNVDPHLDLSYLFRPSNTAQTNMHSSSNETHLRSDGGHTGIYPHELPTFNNHMLPSPFTYGSLCPYHNTNHILNHSPSRQMHTNGSNLPEPSLRYPHHTFTSYPHPSEMSFGQYWPQMTPPTRPPHNYPINSSNIDTLLHLAAHFEQRKRGITREELDKLPTRRYRSLPEKYKQKEKIVADKVNEDLLKCLVCLDDFEVKQSIRTLRCNHEFHAKCIDKWLKINRSCPLCRADAFDGSAQKEAP